MFRLLCLASALLAVAATSEEETYQCYSDYSFGPVAAATHKGLAMDDTSYRWCSESIPDTWPNAEEAVTSMRLFKAWDASWQDDRALAYENLRNFVTRNGAKVLMGVSITCSAEADAQEWIWAKELLQILGPDHIMGLAIGNEVELFFTKSKSQVPQSCVDDLWDGGSFWARFQAVVQEFDDLGFEGVPVTSVFGGLALAGDETNIFYEQPNQALVNSFFLNATQLYGDRYAWTWNVYPYFDPAEVLDEGTDDSCEVARAKSLCWDVTCDAPKSLAYYRKQMTKLTGRSDDIMWIGETGWSSSGSTNTEMKNCKNWASKDSLTQYYDNFLQWDMSVSEVRPPDHAFYFSIRDALNYGNDEHFGIIEQCFMTSCKLHSEDFEAPPAPIPTHPGCYYQQMTAGNGECDGPWEFWKLDEFGMTDPDVMSGESEANCLARKSGHDGFCGTDTVWMFVPEATSSTTVMEVTTSEASTTGATTGEETASETTSTSLQDTTTGDSTTGGTTGEEEAQTTEDASTSLEATTTGDSTTTGTTGEEVKTTEDASTSWQATTTGDSTTAATSFKATSAGVSTTEGTTTTAEPPVAAVTFDTELEMSDVSKFNASVFAQTLAILSDVPAENVVVEKVEFQVTVRYSFEGLLSQAEVVQTIAVAAGVPPSSVHVVLSMARRLEAQQMFVATIMAEDASAVAKIEAGMNDTMKVTAAIANLSLNASAALVASPTTSVLVTAKFKADSEILEVEVPESNALSSQLAEAFGTDVSATVVLAATTTTASTSTAPDQETDAEDTVDEDHACSPPVVLSLVSAILLLLFR